MRKGGGPGSSLCRVKNLMTECRWRCSKLEGAAKETLNWRSKGGAAPGRGPGGRGAAAVKVNASAVSSAES